jgi:ABC-type multidrug transport system ATPase subunit
VERATGIAAETETTIAARDLVKRYGERVALRSVSLTAGRGELVAVIGPNGAGKTTLLTILAGIQKPDEGSVETASRIGWVPQQAALYSKLTVEEPSAALDPRQRERLWEFILRLAEDGTTVVYATHHIQEADRYASQLIVLADGERVFDGSPRELEQATGTTGLDFEQAFVHFLHQRGH